MNALNISASGLALNQLQMDVAANNIANANTTNTANGGPYREQMVVAQPVYQNFTSTLNSYLGGSANTSQSMGAGVQAVGIVQDGAPFTRVYDPTNPNAVNGYVEMSNVNVGQQMTEMMAAANAYQANATAFDASKQMETDAITTIG